MEKDGERSVGKGELQNCLYMPVQEASDLGDGTRNRIKELAGSSIPPQYAICKSCLGKEAVQARTIRPPSQIKPSVAISGWHVKEGSATKRLCTEIVARWHRLLLVPLAGPVSLRRIQHFAGLGRRAGGLRLSRPRRGRTIDNALYPHLLLPPSSSSKLLNGQAKNIHRWRDARR